MQTFLLTVLVAVQADAPVFRATSPEDDHPSGELIRLSSGFSAVLRSNNGETSVRDVISLRRADRELPAFPTGPHIVTTAGDRISGTVTGGDGQFLRFRPSGAGLKPGDTWKLPLSWVAVIWLTDTPARTPLDASAYHWMADVQNQDVLRFRNGDTARGTLEGLNPDAAAATFSFRPSRGDKRSIAAGELAAVAFNPALARFRKPKGPFTRVVLTDGSRLFLDGAVVANGELTGTALFGQKVQLQMAEVVAIDVVSDKAASLSDLKPKKVEEVGFLGATWSWARDRTVRGEALRVRTALGELTADKGLSTHARSTLTYDLGGKYQRFEALVGLDPTAPLRPGVVVKVMVDGKQAAVPGLGTLRSGRAVEVRVNVRGARELVLITDFGPAGGVGGDVNWVDPRLIE